MFCLTHNGLYCPIKTTWNFVRVVHSVLLTPHTALCSHSCRPCIWTPWLFAFPQRAGQHTENVYLLRSFKKRKKKRVRKSLCLEKLLLLQPARKLRTAPGFQCPLRWRVAVRHFPYLSHATHSRPAARTHEAPPPPSSVRPHGSTPGSPRALEQEAHRAAGWRIGLLTVL